MPADSLAWLGLGYSQPSFLHAPAGTISWQRSSPSALSCLLPVADEMHTGSFLAKLSPHNVLVGTVALASQPTTIPFFFFNVVCYSPATSAACTDTGLTWFSRY